MLDACMCVFKPKTCLTGGAPGSFPDKVGPPAMSKLPVVL